MSAFPTRLFPLGWRLVLLAFCLGAAKALVAEPPPFTEPVSFSFKISGVGGGIMTVHDETGPHPIGHTTYNASTESSDLGLARLRPGQKYSVNFQGSGPVEFWLSYIAPANYQLWIEEAGTGLAYPSDLTYEYTGGGEYNWYNYIIELRPILDQSRAGLGDFTGVSIGNSITWSVGLGGLRSGKSAGRISFREKDLTNAPADRARLYYSEQTNDAQIWVAKDGPARLRQIATAQGIVDFIDIDSGNPGSGYNIKFYNWHVSPTPPSYDSGLGRWIPSGAAWRNIRVEPYNATTHTLKITVTENGDDRVSVLQLGQGSGTMASGNYVLILNEGTGAPWARTTTHTSTKSGGVRNEVVEVKGPDNVVVAKAKFTYSEPGDWGEELWTVVAYETASLVAGTTTYDYYTDSANRGNYRRMRSVTDPTGNWVAMQYYDDWDKRGQLKYEFHPYKDDPATVSLNAGSGRVLYFDYATADWTGRHSQPSLRQEFVGGLETGRSVMAIADVAGASPARTRTTVAAYAGPGVAQTSVIETYRGDAGADFIGQLYSVKAADESQVSYALARGIFDHNARTFAPNSGGHDWRVMAFHGSQSGTVGTQISTHVDQNFEPIYLVPEKSILEITYFNNSGLVIRTETQVYTNAGTFAPLTHEDVGYMADSGRLYRREANNGAISERSYHAGRLNRTLDAAGVSVRYEYDELNRVIQARKDGVAASSPHDAQPTVYTHYVYDAANNVKQTATTKSANRPALGSPTDELDVFATASYDFAGRPVQTVANAGTTHALTTGFLFEPGVRKTIVTLPGGAQKVVETFRDGQVYRVTGNAVVSEEHNYFVDTTTYRKVRQSVYGGNFEAWTNTYWDWLGRKVEEWKPGWTPASNVARIWYYNNKGQLWKHTQPDMAPTLFTYDTLGQQVMAGLDLGGTPADTLQAASTDRITETGYRFFVESSKAIREVTTKTYAVEGSNTTTTVSKTRDYLSNLGPGVVSLSSSTDIFGNVMTVTTTVDRANCKVTSTTTAPDATTPAVQLAYNGLLVQSTDTAGVTMRYKYDGLGRRFQTVDPRTGSTTTDFYANTNLLEWVKDAANKTQATYTYDAAGRVSGVKNALNKHTYYSYTPRGQKEYEWGPATYPAQYTYDDEGHLTHLRTYRGGSNWDQASWSSTSPGTPDITRWVYDARTGFLKEKYDAANLNAAGEPIAGAKKVSYTYTLGGKIDTRTWARGVTTGYGYNPQTGELETVNYPSGTSNLIIQYNRLGQMTQVTDATGERTLDHCACGKVVGEEFPSNYYGA